MIIIVVPSGLWAWLNCPTFRATTSDNNNNNSNNPLAKITSRGRSEDVPEKRPDVLRTSPYSPICNAKGRIPGGTSLGRTQDVSLTKIHIMAFYGFFSIFPDSNSISDIVLSK